MGTGYSPIGLALRDVGAGFGSLLESEARRREAAMSREVALGELGLRGRQLENQATREQAQAGVSLAEVGARGRWQERQQETEVERTGIQRQQMGIAEAAEARQERERVGREQFQTAQLAEQKRFHTLTAGAQQTQANAALTQANRIGAYYEIERQKSQRELDEGDRKIFAEDLYGNITQNFAKIATSPEQAQQLDMMFKAMITTRLGPMGNLPIDDTTKKPYFTGRQFDRLSKELTPLWQEIKEITVGKKAPSTMTERQLIAQQMYDKLPNEQKNLVSVYEYTTPLIAMQTNPLAYQTGMARNEQGLRATILPALEDAVRTRLKLPLRDAKGMPTPIPQETSEEKSLYQRMVTDPYTVRQRQMIMDLSQSILAPGIAQPGSQQAEPQASLVQPPPRVDQLKRAIIEEIHGVPSQLRDIIDKLKSVHYTAATRTLGGRGGIIPGDPGRAQQMLESMGFPPDLTVDELGTLIRDLNAALPARRGSGRAFIR